MRLASGCTGDWQYPAFCRQIVIMTINCDLLEGFVKNSACVVLVRTLVVIAMLAEYAFIDLRLYSAYLVDIPSYPSKTIVTLFP